MLNSCGLQKILFGGVDDEMKVKPIKVDKG